MNELIAVAKDNIGGSEIKTVNARDLHAFLEVKKDFSDWIKVQIKRARLVENRDYVVLPQKGENLTGGRPTMEYHLTLDSGKNISMMSGLDKGFEVREYFLECERVAVAATTPALPTSWAETLRMLATEVEQKALAIEQRDEAIRTKAHISAGMVASAMGTASAAVRKQHKLENELGRGQDYKCAKAIPWAKDYFVKSKGMWSSLGKTLKSMSVDLGYQINKIDHAEFGKINAYHVEVIAEFKKALDKNWNILGKYRVGA